MQAMLEKRACDFDHDLTDIRIKQQAIVNDQFRQ